MNILDVFLALIREGRKRIADEILIDDDGCIESASVTNLVLRAAVVITAAEQGIPSARIEACLGTPRQPLKMSDVTSLMLVPARGDDDAIDAETYLDRLKNLITNAATITHAERVMEDDEQIHSAVTSTMELFGGLPMLLPASAEFIVAFEVVLLTSGGEFPEGEVKNLVRILSFDHVEYE